MKKCFKCGAEKPLTEFYKHSGKRDGHLGKCKECAKADTRANREAKLEYYREYDRNRHWNNPERREYTNSLSAIWAKENAERSAKKKREWVERNPEKRSAHVKVGNAIRRGDLVKKPCEVCGADKVHAHHDDYSKPLEVRWLCAEHHSAEHAKDSISSARGIDA